MKEANQIAKFREKVKRVVDAQQLTFACIFDDGTGRQLEAAAGDWLVTETDGSQVIMDADEFCETFEPVAQKGPRAGSRTETALDCEA